MMKQQLHVEQQAEYLLRYSKVVIMILADKSSSELNILILINYQLLAYPTLSTTKLMKQNHIIVSTM